MFERPLTIATELEIVRLDAQCGRDLIHGLDNVILRLAAIELRQSRFERRWLKDDVLRDWPK